MAAIDAVARNGQSEVLRMRRVLVSNDGSLSFAAGHLQRRSPQVNGVLVAVFLGIDNDHLVRLDTRYVELM